MPRLTLRWKLLLFAVAIAVVPILVAARAMIRIGEDELKSSANEQLLGVATELTREINDMFERSWLGPLLLIRNAIDDERLGVQEKISLLTLGLSDIAGHRGPADHAGRRRPAAARHQGRHYPAAGQRGPRPAEHAAHAACGGPGDHAGG